MKKFFLFIKKYWLIVIGVLGAIVLIVIRIYGGKTLSQEKFQDKVDEQKKVNEESIKEAKEQVKKNEDIIKQTDEVVDEIKNNKTVKEILERQKERDAKADNIFNIGE